MQSLYMAVGEKRDGIAVDATGATWRDIHLE